MQDLIEKLEKATEPDRLLDGLIMAETKPPNDLDGKPANIFIRYDGDYGRFKSFAGTPMSFSKPVPRYTESIDAALTLMPDGYASAVGTMAFKETSKKPWACYWTPQGEPHSNDGETPAIALCIAALRARHSLTAEHSA